MTMCKIINVLFWLSVVALAVVGAVTDTGGLLAMLGMG